MAGYEIRDHYRAKRDFLLFFNLSPFQGHKSPRLPTWLLDSLGLLLHRSNVRSYSKPPVPNGELPKSGIKRRFLNTINSCARPDQTGSGRGMEFLASVARWCANLHTKVEVCSCYTFQAISVLNENSENARYGPFSHIPSHHYNEVLIDGLTGWLNN